jgi:hypothetical protein
MDDKQNAKDLYSEGNQLYYEGKYQDALNRFNKSLESNTDCTAVLHSEDERTRHSYSHMTMAR